MLPVLIPADYLEACYAASYAEARKKFKQHALDRQEHSVFREFVYRQTGPANEILSTDVAWLGAPSASRVLVLQSATHGVEGFAGSAIQIDALQLLATTALPDDTAILLIHAINPFGFAWLRRVNEDGVDLNRNFVDFSQPLPINQAYAELAEALLPVSDSDWPAANAQLAAYAQVHGQPALERAVTGGQYQFAEGLFYGGLEATQSRRYLQTILQDFELKSRQQLAVVDIHTGLGPFGYGEMICDHAPASVGVEWARRVYGQSVTEPALGSSSSVPKQGLVDYFWQDELGDRVCFVTLEFGTYNVEQMIEVLRRDHLLHREKFKWDEPSTQHVKQALKNNFYPATADWQEMVLLRGRQVIRQALLGLAETD